MSKLFILLTCIIFSFVSNAQTLGGGTSFSNAVTFSQSWISGCPSGATQLSNQAAYEPTTTMDACAPSPACASGTTGSDVWFRFFAQSTTATIVVAPSSSFDVAIQAFSGSACPGLTDIGCVDAAGNNATETLNLTGLTVNELYYFRIFGAASSVANRTGTYTFCGSSQLGSFLLPAEIISFKAVAQNRNVLLNWTTASESDNAYFEIERSTNTLQYQSVGKIPGKGTTSETSYYSFTDLTPAASTYYYRLKQVDIDGRFKYSNTVNIKAGETSTTTLAVAPGLTTGNINLVVNTATTVNATLNIINSSGQIIYQQQKKFLGGETRFTISNLENISSGIYTLLLTIEGKQFTTRFVKQ